MNTDEEISYAFKIILIGDSGVGKSNILVRYKKNEFDGAIKPTLGMEFCSQVIKINGKNAKLQIWDTAGQERYKAVAKQYYKGAAGVVVVYDITKKQTFQNVSRWIDEVRSASTDDVTIIIVGNKKDLDSLREVPVEDGQNLSDELSGYFLETSALNNSDKMIQKVFTTLSEEIIIKKDEEDINEKKDATENGSNLRKKEEGPGKENVPEKSKCG